MVFDASSVLKLIKARGAEAASILMGGVTIPLIYYEVGNALRSGVQVYHDASAEEAEATLERVCLGLSLMKVVEQGDGESSRLILRNSLELNTTFYDAAYLTAASTLGVPLVTEDRRLGDAAKRAGVEVITAMSLEARG
jgi:predicted nucleic acid-binding protein